VEEKQISIPLWLLQDTVNLLDQLIDIPLYPSIKTAYKEIMWLLVDELVNYKLQDPD